jgi:hypothetical protein
VLFAFKKVTGKECAINPANITGNFIKILIAHEVFIYNYLPRTLGCLRYQQTHQFSSSTTTTSSL